MSKIKMELVTDLKDVNNQLIKITIEDSPYYFCKKEILLTKKEIKYLMKELPILLRGKK